MKRLSFILLFYLTALAAYSEGIPESCRRQIQTLDSLLENIDAITLAKEEKIEQLRKRTATHCNIEEKFWLNKMFYDEYYVYNADSAMKYADANIAIARLLGKKDWEQEWLLNSSFLFAATGLLKESYEKIIQINKDELPENLKPKYYEQMIYLYSHLGQYIGENKKLVDEYYSIETDMKKKMHRNIDRNNPYYYWYMAQAVEQQPDNVKMSFMKELRAKVDSSRLDTRIDAMNSYALAHLYDKTGNKEMYVKYLACSAIADIRYSNRDVASLEELADFIFNTGDIDRAYTYLNCCLNKALAYPNRVRVVGISRLLDKVSRAYREKDKENNERLKEYLVLVSILSAVLIAAVLMIYLQLRKIVKAKAELDNANSQLSRNVEEQAAAQKQMAEMNRELKDINELMKKTNDKLLESNYVKEEYIGYAFSICSNYIGKIEEFRKNVNRKIKAGQIDDIKTMTASSTLVQSELKEFYHSFDAIFLHIYPDFVKDFNSLLRPEEQISLKEGELLNTELRIYALVRLGINDSVKIADFLHSSVQTVYNNRLKTRNKAILPKDEFIKAVCCLGKVSR